MRSSRGRARAEALVDVLERHFHLPSIVIWRGLNQVLRWGEGEMAIAEI
jgi:hypothetical protein